MAKEQKPARVHKGSKDLVPGAMYNQRSQELAASTAC